MKNKPILLTLILTILFSFAVTSVIWAECVVNIVPPEAIILPGERLTFVATTEGEGCNEPNYTWEISQMGCTGSSIDPDTGTYTSGAEDGPCQDTIMVTDTANGGIAATATVTVGGCSLPVVNISGPSTIGPLCPASATYTAESFCEGTLSGTYSWELDGEPIGTANTGNTFEVTCIENGYKTLLVTDTANGNITASTTITCDCEPPHGPPFDRTFEGCGTPLIPWFGVMTIQGIDTIFGPFTTLSYDSPLVLKTPRLLNRSEQTIHQFVILLPSILFPAWDYPAIVEVTASGPSSPSSSAYSLTNQFIIPKCGQ